MLPHWRQHLLGRDLPPWSSTRGSQCSRSHKQSKQCLLCVVWRREVLSPAQKTGLVTWSRRGWSTVHAGTGHGLPPQEKVLVPVGWSSRKRLQDSLHDPHHHCCPWQYINRGIYLVGTITSFSDSGMCPSTYFPPSSPCPRMTSMCLFIKEGLKKQFWHILLLQQAAAASGLVQRPQYL